MMVGGGGVKLSPESVVRQGEFFVAMDARQDAAQRDARSVRARRQPNRAGVA